MYFELLSRLEPSLSRQRRYASKIKRKTYIIDSSIIPLCLSLFDWAKFRTKKRAIKLHAVLDYDSGLPNYACISKGNLHDIDAARRVVFPPNSVVICDRAYVDYDWLNDLDSTGVTFVTRVKSNAGYEVEKSWGVNEKYPHIISDKTIRLTTFQSKKKYPGPLRLVKVYDEENDQYLSLLTNNMSWTANTISVLYKAIWEIEVFFKHLKQLFRIKYFIGTSANAVRIQMWSSMIVMLMLKYFQNIANFKWHLSNLVIFIRINRLQNRISIIGSIGR
nr:IS4 family transposase [Saprospiraceae bacterium]